MQMTILGGSCEHVDIQQTAMTAGELQTLYTSPSGRTLTQIAG
jgi:hypothetical protein